MCKKWILLAGLLLSGMAWGAVGAADPAGGDVVAPALPSPDKLIETLRARFTPAKPTVRLEYEVSYRLLGLELISLAEAVIEATEGLWAGPDGQLRPVCYIEFDVASRRDQPDAARRGRFEIRNRMVSVVTMPDLETLVYFKSADEYLKPPFMSPRIYRNAHRYDLQHDPLEFWSADYTTGKVETELAGALDLASQGREVANVLRLMTSIYEGAAPHLTPRCDFRLQVSIDRQATPFAATTVRETAPNSLLGERWLALRVDLEPAREARRIQRRRFTLWATPLAKLAERIDDPLLDEIVADAPTWSMAPLTGIYGLSLGYLHCSLAKVSLADRRVPNHADRAAGHIGPKRL
ncbi:MAG: hypothetical protein K9N49_04250 [Candidatus Marinimicrobia bacterium]|nr:hypothetical protein [Candidatus Neomarinimicrobiota bacterium]